MRYIKAKTQFEAFHRYKDAPDEVKFLKNEHRHLFIVTAKIQVEGDDRELEFFMVQRAMNKIVNSKYAQGSFDESCEMIAETILDYLETIYYDRPIEVEVSEDGENSGIVNNYQDYTLTGQKND